MPYARLPVPRSRRWSRPVLLAAAAAVGLAACSSGSDSPPAAAPSAATSGPAATTPGTPAPATTPAATTTAATTTAATTPAATTSAVQRCPASALTGSLRAGDAGAGQRSATLVLTNRGGRACRLDGYGGVQLADAAGRALATKQVRDPRTPARAVVLAPGAAGTSLLRWTAVPGAGDTTGPCRTVPASLRVIPPDERTALTVRWALGPVCGAGRLTQAAYRSGA